MKKLRIFGLALLGVGVAACLTTAARADIIIDYTWIQSAAPPPIAALVTSSGTLVYDATIGTISSYNFKVAGAFNFTDTALLPTGPGIATKLADGDLLVSTPPSIVLSLSGPAVDGEWYDYVGHAPPNENLFEFGVGSGAYLYGDWVPTSSVPEPTTLVAGALLLLPFGASTLRILRNKKQAA